MTYKLGNSRDTSRIREWRQTQSALEDLNSTGKGKVKWKEGGRRKEHPDDLDKKLLNWIVEKRERIGFMYRAIEFVGSGQNFQEK